MRCYFCGKVLTELEQKLLCKSYLKSCLQCRNRNKLNYNALQGYKTKVDGGN